MSLLETALKRRTAVAIVMIAGIVAGLALVALLPIKLYPSTTKTRISVRIPHPSYTAEDFADQFSERINQALATVDGIDEIDSEYANGNTELRIYFEWGYPGQEAKALVAAAMAQIRTILPEEAENYSVGFWAGRTTGFFSAAVYSSEVSANEVYELIQPKIQPRLNRMKDVQFAVVRNVEETRVEIHVDPVKALSFGLNADEIANIIRTGYRDLSLGTFREGRNVFAVRIKQGIGDLNLIENILLDVRQGRQILLKDVADVRVYQGLPNQLYTVDGRRAVIVFAMPDEDGNVRDMAEEIKAILADAKTGLPDHISYRVLIDPSEYINQAILNVMRAALIGGGLAILVVLVFLGDVRNTLLIAVSIPSSIVLSFILMSSFGVTINLISLGGLTLAVGMIVDSSIVVIENINRHRRENPNTDFITTIIGAVTEVRGAIITSTLTTLVVFLPLTFTAELTAAILGELAETVIFALTCSLGVALVVVPAVSYVILSRDLPQNRLIKFFQFMPDKGLPAVTRAYQAVLRVLLRSPTASIATIGVSFAILFAALALFASDIRREIIAKPDSNRITLRFDNTDTKTEEEIFEAVRPLEQRLIEDYKDRMTSLFCRIRGARSGAFTMTLKSVADRELVIGELKEKFPSNRTWQYDISRWDPAELPLPRVYDLEISFTGKDRKTLLDTMQKTIDLVRTTGLYADVSSQPPLSSTTEVLLIPRKDAIRAGDDLSLDKFSRIGRILLSGQKVIEVVHNDESMNILLSYQEDTIRSATDLQDFLIESAGFSVPLKHFFDFETQRGLTQINVLDGDEIFKVRAELKDGASSFDRERGEAAIKALLAEKLELPPGTGMVFEDSQREVNSAINSLLVALAASVLLVLVVLGGQFNSVLIPFVIIVSVPLGLIGVVTALFFAESTVSLNSMLGTILLGGVVVNNSILLVDFYQQQVTRFSNKIDGLIYTCGLRMTPILITSLTTILGMMPIALALGDGTNVIQPLGIAVCGGLAVSTLLTLFVVPCILRFLPVKSLRTE